MNDSFVPANSTEIERRGSAATPAVGSGAALPWPRPSRAVAHRAAAAILLSVLLTLAACSTPVRVEWRTETEMNTAGFNLFRGESPDGPFDVKVNEQLIPPSPDPLTGKAYSYIDRTAQTGVTYYYQLQEVERGGQVNSYGPISVRAGGFSGWHALALAGLAAAVLLLWGLGARKAARPREP